MKTIVVRLSLLILCAGLASCAAESELETSWEVPTYAGTPFTDLAVIGVLQNRNSSQAFESKAVEVFQHAGIPSIPGFSFLKGETKLSRDDMAARVKGSGADGVLIFKLVAVDSTETYVPPTTYTVPEAIHPEWWDDPYWGYYYPYPYHYWGYWYPAVQVVTDPGYWEPHQTYRIHAALYSVASDRLVWTANTATFDPSSPANEGGSVAKLIAEELQRRGLVPVGKKG